MSDNHDIEGLRDALESADRHERAQAAVELAQADARGDLPRLRALQDDPDDLVAVAAVWACWTLGDRDVALARATQGLASDDEEILQEAVTALGDMGSPVVPYLEQLVTAHTPEAARILRVIDEIGGRRGRAALKRFAGGDDPALAAMARDLLDDED